jgi:hypothetical protein
MNALLKRPHPRRLAMPLVLGMALAALDDPAAAPP